MVRIRTTVSNATDDEKESGLQLGTGRIMQLDPKLVGGPWEGRNCVAVATYLKRLGIRYETTRRTYPATNHTKIQCSNNSIYEPVSVPEGEYSETEYQPG